MVKGRARRDDADGVRGGESKDNGGEVIKWVPEGHGVWAELVGWLGGGQHGIWRILAPSNATRFVGVLTLMVGCGGVGRNKDYSWQILQLQGPNAGGLVLAGEPCDRGLMA